MFDKLSGRLSGIFDRLRGRGVVGENDLHEAMREVRRALLEADVSVRVARDFIEKVSARALGEKVLRSLTPGQQIVGIVFEEMTALLGGESALPDWGGRAPAVVLLAGLQGSGKTTAAARLGFWAARKRGMRPLLAACDLQRPAAIDQLEILADRAGCGFHCDRGASDPVEVAGGAIRRAAQEMYDLVILDTAGRMHVDQAMMDQLKAVRTAAAPRETVLVLDGLTGQDALNVAVEFERAAGYDSAILTKMDGDSRGGAALSFRAVTGKPVRFAGTGEGLDGLEPFDPRRMAGRILGMGDVVGLVEKARETVDHEEAEKLERKLRKASFTLEDFADQLRRLRKMGPIQDILAMIPGNALQAGAGMDPVEFARMEAIISSMTPHERLKPETIDGSRRKRIARGSGTTVRDVNRLLREFRTMQTMLKRVRKTGRLPSLFRQ